MTPRARLALAAGLALTVLIVYAPVISYPFIQDDWHKLFAVEGRSWRRVIVFAFREHRNMFYRPLAMPYFAALRRAFGLDCRAHHAVALLLHAGSGLLVARVLARVTRDALTANLAAFLYVAAYSVHLDPLLWASGIYDVAGMFFALLCLELGLAGRSGGSAIALCVGLLFKEPVVVAPAILWIASSRERSPAWRRLWMQSAVVGAYGVLRVVWLFRYGSSWRQAANDPYRIKLAGLHLVENLARYLRWTVEALAPGGIALVVACLVGISGVAWAVSFVRRRAEVARSAAPERQMIAVLAAWFALGLLPTLFLPNHAYRYYLTYSLPAGIALLLMLVRAATRRLGARMEATVLIAATAAAVASSAVALFRLDRTGVAPAFLDGTNDLVRKGALVRLARDAVRREAGWLPRGATLVFDHIDVNAFCGRFGVSLWLGDPDVVVLDRVDDSAALDPARTAIFEPDRGAAAPAIVLRPPR